jgi:outer membrane lipoprotein-sorting protein
MKQEPSRRAAISQGMKPKTRKPETRTPKTRKAPLLLTALAALTLSAPALAQGNDPLTRFLDGLFDGKPSAPAQQRSVQPPPGMPGTATSAATAPNAAPDVSASALAPLPPRRPTGIGSAETASAPPAPAAKAIPVAANAPTAQPAANARALAPAEKSNVPPPRMQVASVPATPQAALEQLNNYFNGIHTMVGRFVQTSGRGQRAEGTLYLAKPGKLRFEYDPPSRLEVIADGKSVAIRDRKLATQDLYSLSQTPLKFLLKDRVDLARDTNVVNVTPGADATRVVLEDKSTLGGTSRITLLFDPQANALKQWTVIDPQGVETTVVLRDLDFASQPDPGLFRINYEKMIDTR